MKELRRCKGRVSQHPRGGHIIYIPKGFIEDSQYPFAPKKDLDVRLMSNDKSTYLEIRRMTRQ